MPKFHVRDTSRAGTNQQTKPRTRANPKEQAQGAPAPGPGASRLPREGIIGTDFSQSTFERHATLIGDVRMSQLPNTLRRAMIVRQLQRDYGNRYVQRLVEHIKLKRSETVQTKLTVGPAGDKYEQEADNVAKEVMGTMSSSGPETTQRAEPEEEELQMKPLAQWQVGPEGGDVDGEVENTIQQAKGGGQALPENLRSSMEGAFSADFSEVRLHAGAEADALNNAMSARAFTTGQDVFIRKEDYNLTSKPGQELLAHELTHVIQQGNKSPLNSLSQRLPLRIQRDSANDPDKKVEELHNEA